MITEYEKQAEDFLKKHKIKFVIELGSNKFPDWGGIHGEQFVIKLTKNNPRKQITFDFWGSYNDMMEKKTPTAYDVLACISGDQSFTSIEEVFHEFGYYDMTKEQANSIAIFGRKLNKFFSPEELEDLSEIS